jgi:hypothetical protein
MDGFNIVPPRNHEIAPDVAVLKMRFMAEV